MVRETARRRHLRFLLLFGACCPGSCVREMDEPEPAVGRPELLISAAELETKLGSAGLVVLDVRGAEEYATSHIPGAVRVDVGRWRRKHSVLPSDDAPYWAAEVGGLGVGAGSSVVVYGDRLTDTCRVWWTLKYLGVEKAAVLDGGWAAWATDKRPTTSEVSTARGVPFEPRFEPERLAHTDDVKNWLKKSHVALIDARSTGEYSGQVVRGARGGCIPGATHLEWKELVDTSGRFRSAADIRGIFMERGIGTQKILVPY